MRDEEGEETIASFPLALLLLSLAVGFSSDELSPCDASKEGPAAAFTAAAASLPLSLPDG